MHIERDQNGKIVSVSTSRAQDPELYETWDRWTNQLFDRIFDLKHSLVAINARAHSHIRRIGRDSSEIVTDPTLFRTGIMTKLVRDDIGVWVCQDNELADGVARVANKVVGPWVEIPLELDFLTTPAIPMV